MAESSRLFKAEFVLPPRSVGDLLSASFAHTKLPPLSGIGRTVVIEEISGEKSSGDLISAASSIPGPTERTPYTVDPFTLDIESDDYILIGARFNRAGGVKRGITRHYREESTVNIMSMMSIRGLVLPQTTEFEAFEGHEIGFHAFLDITGTEDMTGVVTFEPGEQISQQI